ncbi:MAG: hypothetical protein BWY52_02166 [Chloroflexi bacterium ADurb.Bin325]|nr:MAG: hypothetical protein BWY52_02166 [Chloroflexi bacterium ADurb.Bin325]
MQRRPGGPGPVRAQDGRDRHVRPARQPEDLLGKLEARAEAAVRQVIDAVVLALRQPRQRGGHVGRICGVAELVRGDAQAAVFLRAGQDLRDEVAAARPEQPGHAHDVAPRQQVGHDALGRGLAARIDAQRVHRIPFAVELAARAVEHLVGADVQQGRARALRAERDVLRAERVHAERPLRVGLAPVHIGVGRGVDDEVGPEVADARDHARIGDVVAGQIQRQDGVRGERGQQLAAQLSVVPGDDHAHGRSFLAVTVSTARAAGGAARPAPGPRRADAAGPPAARNAPRPAARRTARRPAPSRPATASDPTRCRRRA